MKKGIWVKNLFILVVRGKFAIREGIAFFVARFQKKPVSLKIGGIFFSDVDHLFWSVIADVFINRVYTPPPLKINSNDIVVDIGAHKGGFSAFAADKAKLVISIEPAPQNFLALKKLIKDNKLQNIHLINKAIGAYTGQGILYISEANTRNSFSDKDVITKERLKNSISVPVMSLDDTIRHLDKIDFLKMDCEGAEIDILINASPDTLSRISILSAEIHAAPDTLEINTLRQHLLEFFPHIVLHKLDGGLGYLYAWK